MELFDHKETIDKIRKKFPDASDDEEDVEVHMDEFDQYEKRLNLKDILLRAISTPPDDNGTGVHYGKTTYHWAFLNAAQGRKNLETIHYRPPAPTIVKRVPFIFKPGEFSGKKEITYSQYLEFKGCVNEGYTVRKTYFVPEELPAIKPEHVAVKENILIGMKNAIEDNGGLMLSVKEDCEEFIKDRFEEYLHEYQESYNEFYLFRADFFRKLKFEHMNFDHQLLLSASQKDWIDCYFLEGELRKEYTDKIESL